jgi:hypothetical protein
MPAAICLDTILSLLVVVLIIESEESTEYLLEVLRELPLPETLFLVQLEVFEEVLSALFLLSRVMMWV